MENLKEKSVGEIVAADYRTSDIFKSNGIDFCCGGKKSLKKVCEEHHLDVEVIENEIKILSSSSVRVHDFASWKPSFLADYIINTHHKYVEKETMLIYEYAKKVATVHGHNHPEMIEVSEIFYNVAQELVSHMRKEEMILFPLIKQIENSLNEKTQLGESHCGSVENPISMMIHEHEFVGGLLKKMSELTNGYTPPVDACNTFRVLIAKLNEFENDLHTHIHLENNILFPKAIEMERQFAAA